MSEDLIYLERRMRMRQSMYKCADCEAASIRGHAIAFLFHRAGRGNKCPLCGSNRVQKISISSVMEHRWNISVRNELVILRGNRIKVAPSVAISL